ncbi:MAG: ABC transporter substrate-binding protein, partial [Pseudomonadota bacterium]|nr:ABC transporter substrate-binding protein [Pseudomonadota bacterium]
SETVIAVGTPLNTTAWSASKACEESGLPYLIVGADQDNLISEKSIFTFRLTQTHAADLEMLSAFIDTQEPKIQSLGIIYGENHSAIRQARRLRKFCADKNIDLAIWETYRSDERNFYDLLNLIKVRQPQLLFLATNPAAGNKLCQQGQRLEILPPLTIATPVNCIPTTTKSAPPNRTGNHILYPTPWLEPTDREDLPQLKNWLQAQGFAAAELILKTLEQSPDQTSGEIIKTLETTTMTTVYGPVSFSGPGQGHQNPLAWYLCSYNEDGTNQVIFPLPTGSGTNDSETETTTSEITTPETTGVATPDKPNQ